MAKTVKDLVDDVHQAAVNRGMDVSPSDVGFLISLFLEGFVDAASLKGEGVNHPWLQKIADEAASVTDE
jgi:hypothetical protein